RSSATVLRPSAFPGANRGRRDGGAIWLRPDLAILQNKIWPEITGRLRVRMVEQGVGARLLRKEDDRLMRGRGEFVADIRLAGMQDVAFVRSPLAHARIRGIRIPPQYRDSVFTAADLEGVKPIRAVSALPGFKVSEQPVLATGKVRQVGELIAMCLGRTRAEAEDIAATVELDLEELPAVYDMLGARQPDSALVHEH